MAIGLAVREVMGAICWLASYPKSGNTWMRLLLANYRQPDGRRVGINQLGGTIAASRELFEEAVGVDSSELSPAEIKRFRPHAYRVLAARRAELGFVKVHDAWSEVLPGVPLFPPEVTLGVVYLVRNPLDIVSSLAHHRGLACDEAVRQLCDDEAVAPETQGRLEPQLPQRLASWSGHVRSWLDRSGLRACMTRYEDLVATPEPVFEAVVRFAGLPIDKTRIAAAVEATRFDRLQAEERDEGFVERPARATRPFFGRGLAGGWRDDLTPAQVARITGAHGETMRRCGYLDEAGEPV